MLPAVSSPVAYRASHRRRYLTFGDGEVGGWHQYLADLAALNDESNLIPLLLKAIQPYCCHPDHILSSFWGSIVMKT